MVEDEDSITVPLAEALEREGFETGSPAPWPAALEEARAARPTSCCST